MSGTSNAPGTETRSAVIMLDPPALQRLYLEGRHEDIAHVLLAGLARYDAFSFLALGTEDARMLDVFVENLLWFFTKPDLELSEQGAAAFIRNNPIICNLVALSSFRNTDAQLTILAREFDSGGPMRRHGNIGKLLALLNPRSRVRFDHAKLFAAHPGLASLWYAMYFQAVEGPVTALELENLRRHLDTIDPNYGYIGPEVTFAYSYSTYIDPLIDRRQKEAINRMMREKMSVARITNRPDPRRIAVISGRWVPTSSVYKALHRLVAALADGYDLTLVQLRETYAHADAHLFRDVRNVRVVDNVLDISQVMDNDFGLVFYPDLGMAAEERHLAQLRLAPIQVMGLGHSISTFGSEIDYFISGRDAEVASGAEENYSERLVLLPGAGLDFTAPEFTRTGRRHSAGRVVVNCSWYAHRCRHPHLLNLVRILGRAKQPVLFRFFAGVGLHRHNAFLPFVADISSVVGAQNVEVFPELSYADYMAKLEEGDLSIDSFPVGGYNTVLDALLVGLPFVSLEGGRFFNRVASTLLRRAGLAELAARSDEEFVEKAVRLIDDPAWRAQMRGRIANLDASRDLVDPDTPRHFRAAIDHLVANHERLRAEGSRQPILIG